MKTSEPAITVHVQVGEDRKPDPEEDPGPPRGCRGFLVDSRIAAVRPFATPSLWNRSVLKLERRNSLGRSVTAAHRTLDPLVLVRIQAPQPTVFLSQAGRVPS